MKRLLVSVGLLSALALGGAVGGCEKSTTTKGFEIPESKDLEPGGLYVVYNHGCTKGCDQVEKGDLIQSIDGKPVKTEADFQAANVIDGNPHKLEIIAKGGTPKSVEITASPKTDMPPLENVPPFWVADAAKLNTAPDWARRRMFGHASPMAMLVSTDGGILDGRQLYGKKRLMVYWDRGDRIEQASAVAFLQVLQKAQADLNAKGVEVMFVQVQFPTGRQVPMNDSDLREFQKKWSVDPAKFKPLEMYRFPNKTEFNEARELGMENAYTVFENLGKSPTVVLLDERGIVRWHSEGVQEPTPGGEISDPAQFTVIEAVNFSLNKL
jgi:hypothetical protein